MRISPVSINYNYLQHQKTNSTPIHQRQTSPETVSFRGNLIKGFFSAVGAAAIAAAKYVNDIGKTEDSDDSNPYPNDNWPDTAY